MQPNTSKKLSVSRWHKLAKRLCESRAEINEQLTKMVSLKKVNLIRGAVVGDVATLGEITAKIGEIQDISGFIYSIRAAISEANANLGISRKLAEVETLNHLVNMLTQARAFLENDESAVSVENAREIVMGMADQTEAQVVRMFIKPLEDDEINSLVEVIDEWKLQRDTLMDEISDLNKHQLTLTVPPAYMRFFA